MEAVAIRGRQWRSPLGLTAEVVEVRNPLAIAQPSLPAHCLHRCPLPLFQPEFCTDCHYDQVNLSEAIINYATLILQQRVTLQNVPVGSARVVFDKEDFCNFLKHPLMMAASTKAVQVPASTTPMRGSHALALKH